MNADTYEQRLRSNLYRAYYAAGLHHEQPDHIRVGEPEACDGCGDALDVFDTVHDTYRDWLRLRAVSEQPCAHLWDQVGGETCDQIIAVLIETEQRVGIKYADRDSRCPSCTAKQQIDALLAEAGE